MKSATETPFPADDCECYVTNETGKQGPYFLEQIKGMWKSGSITANAGLLWEGQTESVPMREIMRHPRFAKSALADPVAAERKKSRGTFIILGVFLGVLGVHNFYLSTVGSNIRGLLQLITSLCLIFIGGIMAPAFVLPWTIIEVLIVMCGGYRSKLG